MKPVSLLGSALADLRAFPLSARRMAYVAQRAEAVYVLHTFQKKCQRTRQHDLDLGRKRFKEFEGTR